MPSVSNRCPSLLKSTASVQLWHTELVLSARPDRPDALPSGTVLREYTIENVVGHGGFGIVYSARHNELGHLVAIKEYLPPDLALRAGQTVSPRRTACEEPFSDGMRRFRDEATALINLSSHPNVIACKDFFRSNGTAYLVMDFVDGRPLSEVLRERESEGRPFDQEDLLSVAVPLAEGLMHVHRAGLIHRDLKPANILIRKDSQCPVLIDFGAAKQSVAEHTRSLAPYTDGYAALEQVANGRIGPWTDIYGYGAVLWRIAAGGNPPREPTNPAKVETRMSARLNGGADPLNSIRESSMDRFSPQIFEFIDRCMELNDTDRIQDCAQLARALGESIGFVSNDEVPGHESHNLGKSNNVETQDPIDNHLRADYRHPQHRVTRDVGGPRDTHMLSIILRVTLVLSFCLSGLGVWLMMFDTEALERITNEPMAPNLNVISSSRRQVIIDQYEFYMFILSVFLFSRWTYLMSYNAHIVGGYYVRFTPTWAVLWYFVPLANLWKPYQAIKEITKVFGVKKAQGMKQSKRPLILPIWWTLWIAYNHLFSSRVWLSMLVGPATGIDIVDNFRRDVVLILLKIPASIACIVLVGALQRLYEKRAGRLTK